MAKEKTFNLDKMVADAQKRLVKHIDKLTEKALVDTKADFAEARKRLGIK